MRNDYIGTSIDGDRAACCQHHQHTCSNQRNNRTNQCCGNTQAHYDCDEPCQARSAHRPCCDDRRDTRQCNDSCYEQEHTCGTCNTFCGRTPAMVYAAHHDLDSAYCSEKALIRGTLFGCLDKPMCNERCTDSPCATQCQADQFAIWELRLYLNTHPHDQKALALMRKLTEQMDHDCTCAFYPDCNRWSWIDGPWPWEYQRCCGKEA